MDDVVNDWNRAEKQVRQVEKNDPALVSLRCRLDFATFDAAVYLWENLSKAMELNTNLTYLDLGRNTTFGDQGAISISKMLAVNKTLTNLNLKYNDIKSRGAMAIAEAMRENKVLVVLNLSGNPGMGNDVGNILRAIKDHPSLKFVSFANCKLEMPTLIPALGVVLRTNSVLEQLDLHHTQFSHEALKRLFWGIKESSRSNIKTLDLDSMGVGTHATPFLCELLASRSLITTLSLRKNVLAGNVFRTLIDQLKTVTSITSLNFSTTKILDPDLIVLSDYLKKTKCPIAHLEIADNEFKSKGMEAFCDALTTNINLTSLSIASTTFSQSDISKFLSALHTMLQFRKGAMATIQSAPTGSSSSQSPPIDPPKSLLSLDLSELKGLGSAQLRELAFMISSNTLKLEKLKLNHIKIDSSVAYSLVDAIKKNTSLQNLDLAKVSLPNEVMTDLAVYYTSSPTLCNIFMEFSDPKKYLFRKSLSKQSLTLLSPGLYTATQLVKLNLRSNKLTYLDPSISNLIDLVNLDIRNNLLETLPPELGYCTALKKLKLDGNPLRTPPAELRQLAGDKASKIIGYLLDLHKGYEEVYRVKLMFVGQENVGKTTLLSQLKKRYKSKSSKIPLKHPSTSLSKKSKGEKNLSTDGIEINEIQMEVMMPLAKARAPIISSTPSSTSIPSDNRHSMQSQTRSHSGSVGTSIGAGSGSAGFLFAVPNKPYTNGIANSSSLKALAKSKHSGSTVGSSGSVAANYEKKTITLATWDFGGQEVYYSTHQFFLSDHSIFLILWDMRFPEEESRVSYWLQSVQSRTTQAAVIIIGTHTDDPNLSSLDVHRKLEEVENKYRHLKMVKFCIGLSCTSADNLAELVACLSSIIQEMPIMGHLVPSSYMELSRFLRHYRTLELEDDNNLLLPPSSSDAPSPILARISIGSNKETSSNNNNGSSSFGGSTSILDPSSYAIPYKTWSEFAELAKFCHIPNDDQLKRCAEVLNLMGDIVYFDDKKAGLNDLVILDSQYLTHVMATIITTKQNYVKHGILNYSDLRHIWKPPKYPEEIHPHLLSILTKFEIVFTADERLRRRLEEFYEIPSNPLKSSINYNMQGLGVIPSLLPEAVPVLDLVWTKYSEKILQYDRNFIFDLMPSALFSRLLVRILHNASEVFYCWKNGTLVEHGGALVLVELHRRRPWISVTVRGGPAPAKALRTIIELVEALISVDMWWKSTIKRQISCVSCLARITKHKDWEDGFSTPLPRSASQASLGAKGDSRDSLFSSPRRESTGSGKKSSVTNASVDDVSSKASSASMESKRSASISHSTKPHNNNNPNSTNSINTNINSNICSNPSPGGTIDASHTIATANTSTSNQGGSDITPTRSTSRKLPIINTDQINRLADATYSGPSTPQAGISAPTTSISSTTNDLTTSVPNSDAPRRAPSLGQLKRTRHSPKGLDAKDALPSSKELSLASNIVGSNTSLFSTASSITGSPVSSSENLMYGSAVNMSLELCYFALRDCERAAAEGKAFMTCDAGDLVQLDRIAPDVTLADISGNRIGVGDLSFDTDTPFARGSFGEVFKGKYQGEQVAVKRISIEDDTEKERIYSDFRREIWIMSGLIHPNLVQLKGYTLDPHPQMVMEFVPGGDLYSFLHKNQKSGEALSTLSPSIILKIALDIACGMRYLHSATPPFIHRDLKSPNILLLDPSNPGANVVAKVGDFGLTSKLILPSKKEHNRTRAVVNPTWQAPEIMREEEFTEKSDTYAYGIILWELFCRQHPYAEFNFKFLYELEDAVVIHKKRPTIPPECPAEYSTLIQACWDDDPKNRPSFSGIVEALHLMIDKIGLDDQIKAAQSLAMSRSGGSTLHISGLHHRSLTVMGIGAKKMRGNKSLDAVTTSNSNLKKKAVRRSAPAVKRKKPSSPITSDSEESVSSTEIRSSHHSGGTVSTTKEELETNDSLSASANTPRHDDSIAATSSNPLVLTGLQLPSQLKSSHKSPNQAGSVTSTQSYTIPDETPHHQTPIDSPKAPTSIGFASEIRSSASNIVMSTTSSVATATSSVAPYINTSLSSRSSYDDEDENGKDELAEDFPFSVSLTGTVTKIIPLNPPTTVYNLLSVGRTSIWGTCKDGSIRVWDALNGEQIGHHYVAHNGPIKCSTCVLDTVWTTSQADQTLRVWHVKGDGGQPTIQGRSGELQVKIAGHSWRRRWVEFKDRKVRIFVIPKDSNTSFVAEKKALDMIPVMELSLLATEQSPVTYGIAHELNSKTFRVIADNTTIFFEVDHQLEMQEWLECVGYQASGDDGQILCITAIRSPFTENIAVLHCPPKSEYLISGSNTSDLDVVRWNIQSICPEQSIKLAQHLREEDLPASAKIGSILTLSAIGCTLISVDRLIFVLTTKTLEIVARIRKHTSSVTVMALAKPNQVWTFSKDGMVCAWDPRDMRLVSTFKTQYSARISCASALSSSSLWTAGRDGQIRTWNTPEFSCEILTDIHTARITSMLLWKHALWSAGADKSIVVWS